ncbi:predicted protein [Naegleria gruberi]|uniref:Predicted protein n=1 Tax=Naegleria gruberi TaxID=5762 RepID=D2V0Y1_NAEGR|nr:uncharacterized protein NAEGRDRAFT_62455 [Naegleria gruberi]EFC49595.1 predicted protein [Naegleria gruberi]|eukprot:XP_002682339.1 predicted protein [Naegleria gruberi strain NEG-M]
MPKDQTRPHQQQYRSSDSGSRYQPYNNNNVQQKTSNPKKVVSQDSNRNTSDKKINNLPSTNSGKKITNFEQQPNLVNNNSENIYQSQRERNTSKYGKSNGQSTSDDEFSIPSVEEDENLQLMKSLGLPTSFDTTHEKHVAGKANNLSGVKITTKRKVKQVMNLKDKPVHTHQFTNKPRY